MMHTRPNPSFLPATLAALLPLGVAASAGAQCGVVMSQGPIGGAAVNPISSALADYNHDGHLDLAIACAGSGAVNFYTGVGNGTFNGGVVVGTGVVPNAIITGDFNLDGWADFACAGDAGFAAVYRNTGGAFAPPQLFASGGFNCSAIASADFNTDGRPDLVLTNPSNNSVSVLLGNDLGQFTLNGNYPTGVQPLGVAAADFNADGRPDLAVSNYASSTVSVLLCNPGGTFSAGPTLIPPSPQPRPIATADFNLDGRPDIAVGTGSHVKVFLTTGPATFAPATSHDAGLGACTSFAIADVNSDGRPDVIVPLGMTLASMVSTSAGTLTQYSTWADAQFRGVSAGDINNDGRPDAVMVGNGFDQYRSMLNTSVTTPVITQHPQRTTTAPGVPATLTVAATGAPLSYQWRKDGVNLAAGPGHTGINAAALTITSPTVADHLAVYDCVVSNTCGAFPSRPAGLGVADPCGDSDFDGDGDFGTDFDIEAFFRVLGGGNC
jgi:hypothetical protein